MKKYFKELDVTGWEEISNLTLTYVQSHAYILRRLQGLSFIFLPRNFFQKIKPLIDQVFSIYDITCVDAAVYVMNSSKDGSLHCDNTDRGDYRINLPILNTKNTYLQYYTVSDPVDFQNSRYTIKLPGKNSVNTLMDRIEIQKPTVISVNNFHEIIMDQSSSPRITMTLFFNKDLKFLLD